MAVGGANRNDTAGKARCCDSSRAGQRHWSVVAPTVIASFLVRWREGHGARPQLDPTAVQRVLGGRQGAGHGDRRAPSCAVDLSPWQVNVAGSRSPRATVRNALLAGRQSPTHCRVGGAFGPIAETPSGLDYHVHNLPLVLTRSVFLVQKARRAGDEEQPAVTAASCPASARTSIAGMVGGAAALISCAKAAVISPDRNGRAELGHVAYPRGPALLLA